MMSVAFCPRFGMAAGAGAARWIAGPFTVALIVALLRSPAFAQAPINDAQIERRSAAGGLEPAVRAVLARNMPLWIAYRVRMVAGERHMGSWDTSIDGRCCVCRLESGGGVTLTDREQRGLRVTLEPPTDMLVFARAEGGSIVRLRTFTPDCEIDGSGMPVVWLDDVRANDSVSWLASLVAGSTGDSTASRGDRVARPALAAVALHDTSAADRALERFSAVNEPEWRRHEAAFWLGAARGDAGVATLEKIIAQDPSERVRGRAVFGLSMSRSVAGVTKLIELARTHPNRDIRRQAMVALGRTNDSRALKFFEEVLAR